MNFRPRHVRRVALWLVLLAVCRSPQVAVGQIKAFPQAEGAGASANGGRGGDVYRVTKLTDDGSVGTLRHGIESAGSAGRTIVFDVGGWIDINSKLGINNNKRNITIAGQTAPGGVGVRGNQFSVGGDDIIVRHMRFRPGKGAGRVDSAGANADAERVIYDHVSAGFSYDENFSVQATDVTLQYSTVSFGLEDHSAGSLLENPHRVSMHHNLYAHNNTRNPKHRVLETLDWVDNVIYNWDNRAFYMEGTSGSGFFWTANIDGNYFIAGPNQDNTKPLSGGSLDDYGTWWGVNAYDSDGDSVHDGQDYEQGSRGFSDVSSALTTWSDVPYPVEDEIWRTGSTQATYERVLEQFGATPWDRDEIDQLLRTNVESRTGGIISHENQLVAQGVSNNGFGMLGGGVAPTDADLDGMPDAWEEKHGTNPRRASNNNDFDQDGYTDLEEYLNDIAAFPAIGPLEFNGVGRYADWARWTNRWEPSRLDQVHISDGAAFVDAVGQKAGTLRVGHEVGGSGRLYVTSGWLEVTEDLVISGEGAGKLDQYGGEVRVLNGGVEIAGGEYNLRGGRLVTPRLATQAVGEFAFTGGELVANQVDFDLEVTGGTLAAGGDAVGVTSIAGSLSIELGTLAVGIAGPADADQIVVSGDALLSGNLVVTLLGGYAPTAGQSWEILTAGSVAGEFDSVTSGFDVQLEGGSLLLVATGGAGSAAAPEPTAMAVGCVAALALSLARRRLMAGLLAAVAVVTALPVTAMAVVVPVSADSQLSENGTTGAGDATDSGSGAAAALNARFNNDNRNEWLALKFDLSAYPVKARLENVALRTYMFRGNVNNTQTLHLYALAPGTAGEDWDEMTTTYGSMPGFTFDGDSTTNLVDVGGVVQDLGAYAVSGYEAEGGVSLINPASLTSLVKSMGTNDLLTLLVSYQTPANGQWRIMSREATTSDTGLLSGAAGDFAAFLSFDVGASGTLGDYNDDGVVNAADYTVWRDADSGGSLVNEEVSPGTVDIADYLYWRERYGAIDPGTPTIASSHAAPEPRACLLLVTIAAIAAALHRPAPRMAGCNATGNRRVVAAARR